jgi:2',3'-cyclic-nucleotide 2'-phosphodiesterase (5'-nucleotidase family)
MRFPSIAASSLILTSCATPGKPPEAASDGQSVSLVYFADIHAQMESHPELFWSHGKEEIAEAGGMSRIATAVEEIRRRSPGQVLFMDAGDTFQGGAAAAWTSGKVVVSALNAMHIDLAIPGNWEVVYGIPALLERSRELNYPIVAANILDASTGKPFFAPYLIREVNGMRLAIIGFTDPDVPSRQPPGYSAGARFLGFDMLPALVQRIREQEKPNAVILLTHVGLPRAVHIAETVPGIDAVLSGDTHERTYEPIVRGDVWVVEPGSFGSFLGRLDLSFRGGHIEKKWHLIELRADRFGEDPGVKRVVAHQLAPYRDRLDGVIGETTVPLYRYAVAETTLDAVLSDAIREAAGTDISFSNGFRFAQPIMPGHLTESDLWNAYPIVNRLKVGKVTGIQLREFWENELEHVYASDPNKLFGGWLPRPSGLALRFKARAPRGERIVSLEVHGKPVQDDAIYTVAACEREGDHEDTLCRIPHVSEPKVLDLDAHQAVRRYLTRHSPLAEPTMGRVVAVDLPANMHSQFFGVLEQARPVNPLPAHRL